MDRFDIAILTALQRDGRLTNFELADEVGLSASQCSRRRAALENAGIIASYHARLSEEALGLDINVFVEVKLSAHSPDNAQRFFKLINSLDEVQEAYALSGDADYLVRLIVPDLKSLSRILYDVMLADGSIGHVRSSVVLERVKRSTSLPLAHHTGKISSEVVMHRRKRPAPSSRRPRR